MCAAVATMGENVAPCFKVWRKHFKVFKVFAPYFRQSGYFPPESNQTQGLMQKGSLCD